MANPTPADYYKDKAADARRLADELAQHRAEHGECSDLCVVRGWLEKRLEQARYVGD